MITEVSDTREKRLFKRIADSFFVTYKVKAPFEVHIQYRDKDCEAIAEDLEEGGMGLLTNFDIPVGTLIHLKFRLFNATALLESEKSRLFMLDGEVRYKVFTQDNAYRLGVRFMDISSQDKAFIARYVNDQPLGGAPEI